MRISAQSANSGWSLVDTLVAVLVLTLALLLVARIAFAGNRGLDASEGALRERATAREAALEKLERATGQ